MGANILDRILQVKDVLPKKQQKLCHYLVMNCEQVGVMTVAELARAAEVGTTTVMRLVQALGCSGFGDFKKQLLDAALMHTTTSYRGLKQSFKERIDKDSVNTFEEVMSDGIYLLENLATPANRRQFEQVVQLLLGARRIFPLGLRSSKPLAHYFGYGISNFYPHVLQLSQDLDFIYDHVSLYVEPTDVLFVVSIWPCTKKTIEVAQMCHEKGVPVALITNTSLNPITKIADAVIDTNSVNHISGDTVLLAVIEAIISELGRRTAPQSIENIEQIERVLAERGVVLKEY